MGKYDAQAALALRLVSQKGREVAFTRPGAVIDPITQQSTNADASFSANMVGIALTPGKARYVFGEGADISKPRLSVTIAMKNVTERPRAGDRFAWNGVEHALISIELLDPAGDGIVIATGYSEAA